VVDEYSAYTGQSLHHSQHEAQMEARLFQAVDAVIVVSQKLYDAKRVHHPHTYLVPNGVDFDAYNIALADPTLPDDLARIAAPRIGYSGLIGDRLNLSMLYAVAQAHPQWSLVLIGEARLSQQANIWMALLRLPNVHYLGEKSVERVPHYLKGFDVGLMPYQQNRESDYISPLKLYDYLAAGVAVASVEIPAIDCFRPYIHVAPTPANFADAVAAALADDKDEGRAVRRSVAAQHTWDARVQQLSGVIEQQLGERAKVQ
jgi:glycosyltransferase involved in cell wall biosynthesis